MSLQWKIFISYLAVILIGLLTLALLTAFIAPETFTQHMMAMENGHGGRGMMGGMMNLAQEDLDAGFRDSLNQALVITGVAATLAAGAVSWVVSRRITHPIRATVNASQRIAAGHYGERLEIYADDEFGELVSSFNQMAASLAETEAMRVNLIGDVSHELKTPLASIQGFMEGLQDGVIDPTPETFQRIQHEAGRLQHLVHDLQELSRAEASQLQLDLRPHDATELVTAATEWLRPQFDDKGVSLVVELPEHAPRVRADFDRARQVLLNLLGNALQYTGAGGAVNVKVEHDGALMHFAIRDTGAGLAAEDLDRVFQRFYRVDKSRSRTGGGSGIGLTIARHIIEAHGGHIWAESDGLGEGCTFHFTLPVA